LGQSLHDISKDSTLIHLRTFSQSNFETLHIRASPLEGLHNFSLLFSKSQYFWHHCLVLHSASVSKTVVLLFLFYVNHQNLNRIEKEAFQNSITVNKNMQFLFQTSLSYSRRLSPKLLPLKSIRKCSLFISIAKTILSFCLIVSFTSADKSGMICFDYNLSI
jgi:hypothetical protein